MVNTRKARWTRVVTCLLVAALAACTDAPTFAGGMRPRDEAPPDIPRAVRERADLRATQEVRIGGELRTIAARASQLWVQDGVVTAPRRQLEAGVASEVADAMMSLRLRAVPRAQLAPNLTKPPRVRLPDGRSATLVWLENADGIPVVLSVRIGSDEFTWRRTWNRRAGAYRLGSSIAEVVRGGEVVARQNLIVNEAPWTIGARAGATFDRRQLLRWARRFGSLAETVLLPDALQAQTATGLACSAPALALTASWTAWRVAVIAWSVALGSGGIEAILKTTGAVLTASAAVDVAEASYIDCFVKEAKAGTPIDHIANPPELDIE